MIRLIVPALALGFSLLQLGCMSKSKGFNRGELKNQIGVEKPVYDDKDIKAAFSKSANLPKPFKLAVYFKTPSAQGLNKNWRWTEQDKTRLIDDLGKELKSQGLVSGIFPLIDPLVSDEDIRSLRMVAAQHQADALLVVGGAGEIDRSLNNWGWTYAFLLPTLFVPGSKADTLFMTYASLWDVRNEYLYLSAEAEATTQNTYVAAFGQKDKELVEQAKTESLDRLKGELKKMIEGKTL